jgi:hypothetical protein
VSSSAAEASRARAVRGAFAALAAVALLVGLVLLGRFEGGRWVDGEVGGMTQTLAAIGPLASPSLTAYRARSDFDCLVYRRGDNPFALEACVDETGRVVETIDRRRFDRSIHSLRAEPQASSLRVDRALVDRLLQRMRAARP